MTLCRPARHGLHRVLPIGALAILLLPVAVAAQPAADTRVVDYIETLRGRGVNVIYSDELLTGDMRVRRAPSDGGPLERLRAVLAEHDLALTPGPRAAWLVIPAPSASPPLAPQPARLPFTPAPPVLENVIVTASRYAFGRATVPSTHELDNAQLETLPTLGEDPLRATHVLPGVTSSGLSSRFNVRGGNADEALLLLDGVRLYEPFHLRGFESIFSSINPIILESMELHTGGYPSQFGDRMSAVVDMRSATPLESRHYEIAVGTLSSALSSSGRFDEDRGAWLVSLRRGNLDVLADASRSDVGQPQYTDFYGKLSFALDSGWNLTGNILSIDDKISLRDLPVAAAGADYDDGYSWVRADHAPGTRFGASYVLSRSRVGGSREGFLADPSLAFGNLTEERRLAVDAIRADWSLDLSSRHALRFGAEIESATARYDVRVDADFPAPIDIEGTARRSVAIDVDHEVSGRQTAAYAAWRYQPMSRVTAELGLRWDSQSYTGESQLSPRVHTLVDLGPRSTLRASWGRYFQAQGLDELQPADGITSFYRAEEAEHLVVGFERLLGDDVVLRVELYRKELEGGRTRFENPILRIGLLPELLPDRIGIDASRGDATGVEIALDGRLETWEWWVSAARARARDRLPQGWRSRGFEERWSAKGGATWRGRRWTVSTSGTVHAGWPGTSLGLRDGRLEAGALHGDRLGDFGTLDVKATRHVDFERFDLEWFVEVTNLTNRDNDCCIEYTLEYDADGDPAVLEQSSRQWLPWFPSAGVRIEF